MPAVTTNFVLGRLPTPKVVTIWEGFRDWFRSATSRSTTCCTRTTRHRSTTSSPAGSIPLGTRRSPGSGRGASPTRPALRFGHRHARHRPGPHLGGARPVGRRHRSVPDLAGRVVGVGAVDCPSRGSSRSDTWPRPASTGVLHRRAVRRDGGQARRPRRRGARRGRSAPRGSGSTRPASSAPINWRSPRRAHCAGPATNPERDAPYDHCVFTVIDDAIDQSMATIFDELLFSMSFDDPEVRTLLELEGLHEWRPGRTSGFAQLERAVDLLGLYDAAGRSSIARTGHDPAGSRRARARRRRARAPRPHPGRCAGRD